VDPDLFNMVPDHLFLHSLDPDPHPEPDLDQSLKTTVDYYFFFI
jgi:hypothetical protein